MGGKGNGSDPETLQVAVTLKHFDANTLEGANTDVDHGLTRHTVDVNLTNYLLADEYWPAFKKSIRDAGAKGVMYGTLSHLEVFFALFWSISQLVS